MYMGAAPTVRGLDLAGKTVIDASNRGGTPEKPVCDAIAELQPGAQVYNGFWETTALTSENICGDPKSTSIH